MRTIPITRAIIGGARAVTPPLLWNIAKQALGKNTNRAAHGNATRQGLNGLDTALEPFLNNCRNGYFVELGANDGVRESNTYFLEKEFGWRGILIEPSLNNYLQLIRNRSTKNYFACAACVPFNYSHEFVRMTYANLMSVSRSLASDLPDVSDHIDRGTNFLKSALEVVDYGAIARTLSEILDSARAPAVIDFMSLDVEGAELSVLQGIDHSKYRFQTLLVESRSPNELCAFLNDLSYSMVAQLSGHDFLFQNAGPPD